MESLTRRPMIEGGEAVPQWILRLLDEHGAGYGIIYHQRDAMASETAAHTGSQPLEFAKTVILDVDGEPVMAVVPANHHVDLAMIAKVIHATRTELMPKSALRELFPDSEVGAEPPFGAHYGMRVLVSAAMALDELITFNAGSHAVAIQMRYADYQSIVKPRVGHFSVRE